MAAVVKTISFKGEAVTLINEDDNVEQAKVDELRSAIVGIPGFQSVEVEVTSVKSAD